MSAKLCCHSYFNARRNVRLVVLGQEQGEVDRAVCSYELYESAEIAHEYQILMQLQ